MQSLPRHHEKGIGNGKPVGLCSFSACIRWMVILSGIRQTIPSLCLPDKGDSDVVDRDISNPSLQGNDSLMPQGYPVHKWIWGILLCRIEKDVAYRLSGDHVACCSCWKIPDDHRQTLMLSGKDQVMLLEIGWPTHRLWEASCSLGKECCWYVAERRLAVRSWKKIVTIL